MAIDDISSIVYIVDDDAAVRDALSIFIQSKYLMMERVEEAIKLDFLERKHRLKELSLKKRIDRLTSREREVLHLIIDNHTNKEVARMLDISHRTIEAHRSQIMRKLEVENLSELIKIYIQNIMPKDF